MQAGVLAAIVLALSFCSSCFADGQAKLIKLSLGVHHFPPGLVASSDGKQCGGTAVDKLNKIFLPSGYVVVPVCSPPARIYRSMDTGDIDLSLNTLTNTLINKTHIYLLPAFTQLVLVLYSHPASAMAPEDKTVSAVRGFDYQGQRVEMQQHGFQFVDMPDTISATNFFLHKRSQYLISYEGPFLHAMQEHYPGMIKTLSAQPLTKIDVQVVVSVRSVHRDNIIKIIQDYAKKHQCNYIKECVKLP